MKNAITLDKTEPQISEVLNSIENGELHPSNLSKKTKEACIEALGMEGMPYDIIGHFLFVNEEDVRRVIYSRWKKEKSAKYVVVVGVERSTLSGGNEFLIRKTYQRFKQSTDQKTFKAITRRVTKEQWHRRPRLLEKIQATVERAFH